MSFLNKFKSLFGLDYSSDDDFTRDTEMPSDDHHTAPQYNAAYRPQVENPDMPLTASPEMVAMIFEKVVEVTNEAVPAYFASSLNTERQKKYLYDALDESVKKYLASLEVESQNKCMALWQKERDNLKTEMDNLKQRAKEIEAKRAELNEQKLSADRQRRALSERVHDLENKVNELEAEKEQFEIENRSLINKAKVANVYEADMESMRKELEELRKNGAPAAHDDTEHQQLLDEKQRLAEEVAHLRDEVGRLNEACETAKIKDEMNSAMLNDLQKLASESQQSVKDLNVKIEELNHEIALRDAQIDDLKKQISERDAQIDEDEETMNEIQAIAQQLAAFEDVKKKLQDRITSLKEDLKQAQKDNEMLKATIQNNLYSHAQQEQAMRDEIEQLRMPPEFDHEIGNTI